MRRSLVLALTGLLAVPLVTVATTAPAAAEVACTGSIGATSIDDTVRVPDGASCTLTGTTIDGNVLVGRGASLDARGVTVGGNVQDDDGGAGAVLLRDSRVGGNVQLEDGAGRIELVGNTVGGDVQPNANRGGVVITGNTIDGNLQCQANSPAPTGGENVVRGSAEDQCAGLTGAGTPSPSPTAQPTDQPTTPPAARSTSRVAGADRYETSALVSRRAFPGGATTVYLARADEPADALSAGSLTDGPVLLVPRCGALPAPIATEIRRLGATSVVALGGSGAVCDAVLDAAARA